MTSKLSDSLIDELVKNCKTVEDVLGDNGVVDEITKGLLERMFSSELTILVMRRTFLQKEKTKTVVTGTVQKQFLQRMIK